MGYCNDDFDSGYRFALDEKQFLDIQNPPKWYESHGNIYELAEWLVENDLMAEDFDSLLRLIEKPWRWNDEWKLYQKELADKELEKCS